MKIKKSTRRKIFIITSIILIYMIGRIDIIPKKNKLYKNSGYHGFVANYLLVNEYNEDLKTDKDHVKMSYTKNGNTIDRLKYHENDEYFIRTSDGIESYAVDDLMSISDLVEEN